MTDEFRLPGAKNFSNYLQINLGEVLAAEGPEIVDRSYNGEYGKMWIVKKNGETIGKYYTFGPMPGETDFGREFWGRIPGYRNECVVVSNRGKPASEETPEDSVSLVYANQRFEAQDINEGPGKSVDTPWQRQDSHDKIPFP